MLLIPTKIQLIGQLAQCNIIYNDPVLEEPKVWKLNESLQFLPNEGSIASLSSNQNACDNKVSPEKKSSVAMDSQVLLSLEHGTGIVSLRRTSDELYPWVNLEARNNWSVGNLANINKTDSMKLTVYNVILRGSMMSIATNMDSIAQIEKEEEIQSKSNFTILLIALVNSGTVHIYF